MPGKVDRHKRAVMTVLLTGWSGTYYDLAAAAGISPAAATRAVSRLQQDGEPISVPAQGNGFRVALADEPAITAGERSQARHNATRNDRQATRLSALADKVVADPVRAAYLQSVADYERAHAKVLRDMQRVL